MTTIAYDGKTIAYDSRETMGDFISSDKHDKHIYSQGIHFFYCGTVIDCQEFINSYESGECSPDISCQVFMAQDGQVYRSSHELGTIWVEYMDEPFAMGTGADFAIGAMDMGADAKQAVKIACGRDTKSGGRIRTFKVK